MSIKGCIECIDAFTCAKCSAEYNLGGGLCHLKPGDCSVLHCTACSAADTCVQCDAGYKLTADGKCEKGNTNCLVPNCAVCGTSASVCV